MFLDLSAFSDDVEIAAVQVEMFLAFVAFQYRVYPFVLIVVKTFPTERTTV